MYVSQRQIKKPELIPSKKTGIKSRIQKREKVENRLSGSHSLSLASCSSCKGSKSNPLIINNNVTPDNVGIQIETIVQIIQTKPIFHVQYGFIGIQHKENNHVGAQYSNGCTRFLTFLGMLRTGCTAQYKKEKNKSPIPTIIQTPQIQYSK